MTNAAASTMASSRVLITGMSTPGRVVEKLSGELVEMVKSGESGVAQQKGSRKLRQVEAVSHPDTPPSEAELQKMRDELKLPGVKDEVRALREVTQGTVLLDEAFTVNRLQTLAETGEYRVIHVASHGMFGGSAETSFIMAHDDIVNSNQLQTLLQTPRLQKTPIELLALSACQTAEGNDRAPLGISGVAIRARAKTVLGTLWPVADEAARQLMADFYRALRQQGLSKTQALRQAQLQLIKDPKLAHPMFWSPFVLIGNWQ
jgi:CHAT domain-containing protein